MMSQAGVSKLKEAREVVDTLKKKAADQSLILAEKQKEADESMTEISNTIQVNNLADEQLLTQASGDQYYNLLFCGIY
jgi:uncharacterized protein YaiL (DUF2058 family)